MTTGPKTAEPQPAPPRYRVAEAARAAGIAPSTLRLWEAQGLIASDRLPSGHRVYGEAEVARLCRIAHLRRAEGLNPAAIRARLAEEAGPGIPALPPAGGAEAELGARLRRLRLARGETLDQAAQAVAVSASALSTLERTGTGVSFKTLSDIARHFGSTVSALSGQDEPGAAVVRAGARRHWPMPVPGVTVELLAEGRRQMDCHLFRLAPGAGSDGGYGHEGEEFIHVLAGRFRITLDETETHDLGPGDSLYFESRRSHAWLNPAEEETRLIWVNTPPSF